MKNTLINFQLYYVNMLLSFWKN